MAACRHDQMSIQEYNKKINGLKSSYDIVYFSLNCLVQIEHKVWDYCFCSYHTNDRLWKEEIPKNMLITKNFVLASVVFFWKKICNMLFSWSVFLILFTLSRFAEETANVELFMSKKWLIKCSIGNSRSKRINFPKWITVICCFDNFFISLIYSSLIFVWFVCFLSFSQLKKSKKMVNYESSIPRFEKFWTQFEQVWVLWLFLL